MKFAALRTYTQVSKYKVDVAWRDLKSHIFGGEESLELNPDFQRGHVWSKAQQKAYVEYKLSGGFGANDIFCNCPGWMNDFRGPYQLVDGLQRITAVLRFLENKLKVFDKYFFEDLEKPLPYYLDFSWHVNNLPTRKEVLKWYLELNSNGVVHSKEELARVRGLLEKERSKK